MGRHLPNPGTVRIEFYAYTHSRTFAWLRSVAPVRSCKASPDGCSARAGREADCSDAAPPADPEVEADIKRAWDTYLERRERLSRALAQRGVACTPGEGLNLWIAVDGNDAARSRRSGHPALRRALPSWRSKPLERDHLRLTISCVREGFDSLRADIIADAAAGGWRDPVRPALLPVRDDKPQNSPRRRRVRVRARFPVVLFLRRTRGSVNGYFVLRSDTHGSR